MKQLNRCVKLLEMLSPENCHKHFTNNNTANRTQFNDKQF